MTLIDKAASHVLEASRAELFVHAIVAVSILICATVLGLHGTFNSGDLLAVFTMVGTGTAAVAGTRAGTRQIRSGDEFGQHTNSGD